MLTPVFARHRDSQSGAAMLEAAIVLPFLFILLMTVLDLCRVYSDHLIIREAHYSAARAGALQTENCGGFARADFTRRLQKLGLASRIRSVSATSEQIETPVPPHSIVSVRGLNLNV